jgi:hypothetical protein
LEEFVMKKTLLATGMMLALGTTGTANAAFTALADGDYQLVITSGCFDFGNCVTSGKGVLSDNTTANQANTDFAGLPFGSGITNDGFMGVIDFTLTGGSMSVTSFSQDSYLGTAGGTFYLRSTDLGTMGGSIDGSGNVTFDPTGRQGLAANFLSSLGEQEWNRDDSATSAGGTGNYDQWTTGTSTNRSQGLTAPFTLTGSALQDAGAGTWTGTLVSAGIIGQAWGDFDGTQYSEMFNVTITAASNPIPVPAAVWLFGSGLMGLVGVARRRKQS